MDRITLRDSKPVLLSLFIHLLILSWLLADFQAPLTLLDKVAAAERSPQQVPLNTVRVKLARPMPPQPTAPDTSPKQPPANTTLARPKPVAAAPVKPAPEKPAPAKAEAQKPVPKAVPENKPPRQIVLENTQTEAIKPAEQSAPAPRNQPLQQARRELKQQYLAYLNQVISEQQRYPRQSRRRGETGVISLRLVISQNGELKSVHIIDQSRYNRLNREALAMVRRAAPFRPLPASMANPPLTLVLPVEFKLTKHS